MRIGFLYTVFDAVVGQESQKQNTFIFLGKGLITTLK